MPHIPELPLISGLPVAVQLVILAVVPMLAVQLLYSVIDLRGRFAERLSFAKRHRILFQVIFTVAVAVVFGAVSLITGLGIVKYLVICGAFVGLINGISIKLMK